MSVLSSIVIVSLLVHSSLAAPVNHPYEVEEKGHWNKPYTQTYEEHKYEYPTYTHEYKPEKTYGYDEKSKYDEKYKYESYKPEPTHYQKWEEPPKFICQLPPKDAPWYGEYYKWAYGSYPPNYKSEYKPEYEYKKESDYKSEYDYKYEHKTEYKPEHKYKPEHEYKTEYKPEYKPEHEYKTEYKPEHKPEYKPEYKDEYTPPAPTKEVTPTPPIVESTSSVETPVATTTSASSVESVAESSSSAAPSSTAIEQVTDPALDPARR